MMVILVDLELQQSIDLLIAWSRMHFQSLNWTWIYNIRLVESVYFGSEFTRVKNMTCIDNKFDLAL